MSEIEDFGLYFDSEVENLHLSHRKNSFIDLLSSSHIFPEDNLIDIQMDLAAKPWDVPELSTQPSETEVFELHLDEVFQIETLQKRQDPISRKITQKLQQKSETFMIGTLTVKERKEKIAKYLEKRKKRTWKKKIYYDCRKRVADNRLRIKGRFVTKDQAISILGPDHEAIKHLL